MRKQEVKTPKEKAVVKGAGNLDLSGFLLIV